MPQAGIVDCHEKVIKARIKPCNIFLIQFINANVLGQLPHGAAKIHCAADHADTGAFAHDRSKVLAVMAAHYGLAAAHEFKREAAHALEHPEFRGFIKGVVLHEGA